MRLRLFRLFGFDDHQLCLNVYPHAKSNGFLGRIGQYYALDQHIHNFDYGKDKLWADVGQVLRMKLDGLLLHGKYCCQQVSAQAVRDLGHLRRSVRESIGLKSRGRKMVLGLMAV